MGPSLSPLHPSETAHRTHHKLATIPFTQHKKIMKMRNIGKVYPSPPVSSSSSVPSHFVANREALSVLKFLATAILSLASVIFIEDYMITRLMMMSALNPSSISADDKKKKSTNKSDARKSPVFDCGCFNCYTSY
ncbi:uncharacterized protein LOC132296542 [Cornus florida]|uniref:uncharacterized protein LOC132296542 n=1 Tax=Cornus florida TaxID=4283 RepID=UPI00289DC3D7|nr:uncharacterized protein LOC132296542 [Cornus florida]